MAEIKNKNKNEKPLVGAQIQPVTLDSQTKIDIDTSKKIVDNILEAGLSSQLDTSALEEFTTISNSRDQIYQLIDTMMQDSSVASIVRTYAEDVCEAADNGHIVWCESDDPNISKFVNYLLNVMNVDKNMYKWTYSLIEYGDVYLRLFRESDYKDPLFNKDNIDKSESAKSILNEAATNESIYLNIHKANDPYSYYVEMIPDPGTMFELTKFGKTYGFVETPNAEHGMDYLNNYLGTNAQAGTYNYKMKSNDVNVYQADDFVHACLDDNHTRYPEKVSIFLTEDDYKAGTNPQAYTVKRGKSLLYDSYKIWREKSLLENAALLNRITKSSVVRTIQVEVGDMPKTQAQNTLRRVKELFEQKSAINVGNGMQEYTNPGPVENNVYLATHGGQGNVTVGTIGGDVEVKNLADLDYWNNKYYSSYGIPKQYFGWCLGKDTELLLLDGTTHTIEELYSNKGNYIGKGIMGCNSDGSLCPTKITNIILTNEHAKLLRVWLDNGKYVDVTPDHKMMLRNGSFVRADELVEGDSLMPYYDRIKEGRRQVLDNKLGKFISQHHVVASKAGIPVELGYNIHHKDRNKLNDDFGNLIKLSIEDHCKEHNFDLATMHKQANEKRKQNGEAVNANVGCRYITNGEFYTTLKAGEDLPNGFWYAGPKKSAETKSKISITRKQFLADHPEYKNLGGFKAREASEETINNMKAGQAAYWANMTPEEQEARRELSRRNGRSAVANMQAQRMAKLEKGKPEVIRKLRKLRCPVCDAIFEKPLNDIEYKKYLSVNQLQFCCPEHRNKLDAGGKLARSYQLYLNSNLDAATYEHNRLTNADRPDTYLKFDTLESNLDLLNAYVPEVNHNVAKIEELSTDNKVYDITVADDCHTFALPCGIFVHNCDDGAGFNGGSSLTILSSVYAKGVKRVQNAMIQAITDIINLILINKGCKAYLNNFVLKMKTPSTQEEKDYREDLINRISAISNMQSLFSDVEDKARKLEILKSLIATLNYGDDLLAIIDAEIEAAELEAAKKEAEQAEADNETAEVEEAAEVEEEPEEEIDLGMSNVAEESFENNGGQLLVEGPDFTDDDLPSPEELSSTKDFTENI